MSTFGNTSVETGNNFGVKLDTKLAYRASLPENGVVTSISCYSVSDGGVAKAFVYSDSGDQPSALLGITGEESSADGAWVTFTLATPLALSAGNYWLGVIAGTGGFTTRYSSTGGLHDAGAGAGSDSYADGPANPWDSHVVSGTYKVSFYATYSPYLGTGALTIGSPSVAGEGPLPRTGTGALLVSPVSLSGAGHLNTTGTGALTIASPTLSGAMWMDSAHLRHLGGKAMLWGTKGRAEILGLKGKASM